MHFADPKNDLAFKKIFGDSNHKNILISFLNSLIGKNNLDKNILDFKYLTSNFVAIDATILDNKTFFVMFRIVDDIYSFDTSKNIKIIDSILFSNNLLWNDFDHFMMIFIVKNIQVTSGNYCHFMPVSDKYTGKLDLSYFDCIIELPKFTKALNELQTLLDKWIYFIKNASDLTVIPAQYEEITELKDAFEIATQTTWNAKELEVYEYIGLKEFDEINALRTAERKGEERGEQQAKIQIAKNLLDILDNATIASKTGLSEEIIENLRR